MGFFTGGETRPKYQSKPSAGPESANDASQSASWIKQMVQDVLLKLQMRVPEIADFNTEAAKLSAVADQLIRHRQALEHVAADEARMAKEIVAEDRWHLTNGQEKFTFGPEVGGFELRVKCDDDWGHPAQLIQLVQMVRGTMHSFQQSALIFHRSSQINLALLTGSTETNNPQTEIHFNKQDALADLQNPDLQTALYLDLCQLTTDAKNQLDHVRRELQSVLRHSDQ